MAEDSLDPQTEALLEQLDAGVSPPSWTLSVAEGRKLLVDLFGAAPGAAVAETTNLEIQGPNGPIPVRIYEPETGDPPYPLLVYLHGGGWVRGSVDAYDPVIRRLANESESLVVSPDYRRAPEHPFPTPFEDCYRTAEWAAEHAAELLGDPDRLAIGGDSVGGNFTAAVTLAARDRDGPAFDHQLLIYPALNAPRINWFDSYEENGHGYFLEIESVEYYVDQYLQKEADFGNAYALPLRARDLRGLPDATLLSAGYDILRDEGLAYADRLEDAGVSVNNLHYDGQIHGFVNLGHYIDEAEDAIDALGESLRENV